MKNIKNIIVICFIAVLITGCGEDYLDLAPRDELSEASTFSTYNNVKIYAWSFYEFFNTYQSSVSGNIHTTEPAGDLIQNGYTSTGDDYIWGRVNIPTESGIWNNSFANIRKVNLLLDNIGESQMTEEEIAHWRGVGLFFRAHEYFKLLNHYGGVRWLETTVKDTDTEILYGPRDSRDLVSGNILRDLQEAITSVKTDGDGPNTVNKDVVRAFLSRFGLFEGTWRKYHNLGGHESYLNASIEASRTLIEKYPNIHPSYDQVYNSLDLAGVDGIILYKHFVVDVLTHWNSTNTRSTNNQFDITKKGIDMFLCKDGQTIWNSSLYQGDKDYYAEFRDRDTRLLVMTPPPYKVNGDGTVDKWSHTGNMADQEYFSVLEDITGGFPYKNLPDLNWSGRATGEVPNFDKLRPTQTTNGYRLWKIWNEHNFRVSSRDINDFPIFRIGEVMLNYAEAAYEMGMFNQGIADLTINKLRARGEVAPFDIATTGADFDPTRDPDIDPILWEIRRERGIELMADGYRRDDLRRWKKMDYASAPKLGRWIKQSDYGRSIPIQNNAAEGYVQVVPGTPPPFPEHYYLYPIPSNEIVLNPQLTQNPGW